MKKDLLVPNPTLSRIILIGGAIIHFLACIPLYGRRGFPEIDPFWLALQWLWIPPICISAIYSKRDYRRDIDLLIYVLVTGFTVSWSTVTLIPNRKGPFEALLELPYYGFALLIGTVISERSSRWLLSRLRRLSSHPHCEKCGYLLKALTIPRCPECGTSFSLEQLDPSYTVIVTPFCRRWTSHLMILLVVLSFGFPIAYQKWAFSSQLTRGREMAEEDWSRGTPIWFITREELESMSEEQIQRLFTQQTINGFEIRTMWTDWEHLWHKSYRETIERRLRESGQSRPSFD